MSSRKYSRLVLGLMSFGLASGVAHANTVPSVSLCELAAHPERYEGKRVSTSGVYSTSYHISYFSTEKCPHACFNIRVDDQATGLAVDKFRMAIDDRRRMQGGDYYVELTGTFRQMTKADREMYGNRQGRFTDVELKYFTEEISLKDAQ